MAETEEKVQEKIMDMETFEMVDNPEFKKVEESENEETEEEKADRLEEEAGGEEEETEDEKAARLEKEENETEEEKAIRLKDEEDGETDEEREAREAEEAEAEETEEEKEARLKKEEEEEIPTFESLISENLSEKYAIDNEEDLLGVLDNTEKVLNNNEQLKADLEKAKKQDPVFNSDKEKKAFEFLKEYTVDKFGNGLGNYARLIGIEPDKMDGKLAMQEAYVLKNSELEREDAIELFNDEYEQYSVNRDEFEEDADYEKKQKLKDIKKKKDVSTARNFLIEQQEKFKSSDKEEKVNVNAEEQAKKDEAHTKSVAKYSKQVDDSLDGFDSLIFKFGDKKDSDFVFKLNEDQLNKIELSMKNYLKSSDIYDDKGDISMFSADETKVSVALALFGPEIIDQVYNQGVTNGNSMKVEDIGGKKPTRKSSQAGGKEDVSMDDQFEELAKQRAKAREKDNHYID